MASQSTYAKNSCDNCMKAVEKHQLKSCSRCHLGRYCSKECQKAAWPEHRTTCSSELYNLIYGCPNAYSKNKRLTEWIEIWGSSLSQWCFWGLNVNASVKDKLSTHCVVLSLAFRPEPPSPAQYFRLLEGKVLPQIEVLESYRKKKTVSQKDIGEWLAKPNDNTMKIIVSAECFIRCLTDSMDDIQTWQERENSLLSDRMADGWLDALRDAVEEGNHMKAHYDYALRVATDFFSKGSS